MWPDSRQANSAPGRDWDQSTNSGVGLPSGRDQIPHNWCIDSYKLDRTDKNVHSARAPFDPLVLVDQATDKCGT